MAAIGSRAPGVFFFVSLGLHCFLVGRSLISSSVIGQVYAWRIRTSDCEVIFFSFPSLPRIQLSAIFLSARALSLVASFLLVELGFSVS